jgi:hypothetical protein
MRHRVALVMLCAVVACGEPVAPVTRVQYQLESFTGSALPAVIFTDYDITVSVLSDVITLASDSTFTEVARFRASSPIDSVFTADTASGTYTVSGSTLYLLMASARNARLTIEGTALRQNYNGGELVYRRR